MSPANDSEFKSGKLSARDIKTSDYLVSYVHDFTNSVTRRVQRAMIGTVKTGSQFPTLKAENNRGLVTGNQSE